MVNYLSDFMRRGKVDYPNDNLKKYNSITFIFNRRKFGSTA